MLHLKKMWWLCLVAVFSTGCQQAIDESVPTVAVSIEPQRAILEAVAGERCRVVCLMGEGSNPETFEPTMSQLRDVEGATLYLSMGGIGGEEALLSRLDDGRLTIVDCTAGIERLQGGHGNEADPHVWTSVANCKRMATIMLNALVKLSPANADYFTSRHDQYQAHLDSLDNALRSELASSRGKTFAVWHPSLAYFARDYDLQQVAIDDGREPSAVILAERIAAIAKSGATLLVVQPQYDGRQSLVLNNDLHLRVVEYNPMSADWENQLKTIAHAIATD